MGVVAQSKSLYFNDLSYFCCVKKRLGHYFCEIAGLRFIAAAKPIVRSDVILQVPLVFL